MIGGLGGFVLPIAFGFLNDLTGLWSSCFMLLFVMLVIGRAARGCMSPSASAQRPPCRASAPGHVAASRLTPRELTVSEATT